MRLSSEPPCDLTVDGAPAGRGQATAGSLTAGLHEVRCRDADKAIDLSMKVSVSPGEQRQIDIAPGKGLLTVKAYPWGHVYVDGRDLGLTPIRPQQVYEGRHRVVGERRGKREEEVVVVPRDGDVEVKLHLD